MNRPPDSFCTPECLSFPAGSDIALWGAFIRFTLVSRAFGPRPEAGLGLPGSTRTAHTRKLAFFEVERKALRLGPGSPQSEPAESGHSSPPTGVSPYPRSAPHLGAL
jgi:hypothetical protein